MSPYLFIIIEEIFSRIIKAKVEMGKIGLFSHPTGAPVVSHLFYVNNMMIFANATKGTVQEFMGVLGLYERWSGQKKSLEKSTLYFSKWVSQR